MELLVKNGANVNSVDNDHYVFFRSFLMIAIQTQNINIVKLLLENGADVNQCDEMGNNSLIVAARTQSDDSNALDIIKLLLKYNVNIKQKNIPMPEQKNSLPDYEKGHTALSESIIFGNANVFFLLLENGASLDELTDINYLIKSMADLGNFTDKHLEILELLLSKTNDNDPDYLYEYARGGNINVIKLLIEKYNYFDVDDRAFLASAENNHYDLTKYLLEKNGSVLNLNEVLKKKCYSKSKMSKPKKSF